MNDRPDCRWREIHWRRPLTAAEQAAWRAWLAAHPEARADWEWESALSAALARLPDVPVPSNFTARVLQQVEREAAAPRRPAVLASLWRGWRWWPRAAAAALAAVVLLAAAQLHRAVHRAHLGRSVVMVSQLAAAPSPDSLADFEPIRCLSPAPGADTELLDLLQ